MTIIQHPIAQYTAKRAELTRVDEVHFSSFIRLSTYLARYPSNLLTPSELRVLLFILGRTLTWKKRAENIAFRHFLEGVYHEDLTVNGPTGLAKQAVRDAIEGLRNKDYLVIHSFRTGNTEYHWRFYEPMVGRLLEDLTSFSMKRVAKPLPVTDPPPSRSPGDINNSNINNLSSYEDSASKPPTKPKVRRVVRMAKTIATDCKPIEDLIAGVRDGYITRSNARVDSNKALPKHKWPTNVLQALLDRARADAEASGYRTPRIVVNQRFINKLHSGMVAHQISDPLTFFTWVLKNWEKIASANRRAKARQAKQTQAVQSEMSLAPNFNDLALRVSYHIAFYNDREQSQINEDRVKEEKQQKVAKVQEASTSYLEAKREQARKADLAREAERSKSSTPVRRTRRHVPIDDDFLGEEEAPLYRSRTTE